jgi:demethylmenaquinone methyltransferase/2-methoxy-6-polyprenyl-1,4-benzoquinol methylase
MIRNQRVTFFDSIAPKWDEWEDLALLAKKLDTGIEELGLGRDETVLDVGCGTGNLTRALLARLSSNGRVTAVDFSPAMVRAAQKKISDSRVTWHVADAMNLPIEDASFDRVICYSVWPHFDDYPGVLRELWRVLRPVGMLHIWHLSSRKVINDIHASAGEAVMKDVLAPVEETRAILERCGFAPFTALEDEARYLVSAVKTPISI